MLDLFSLDKAQASNPKTPRPHQIRAVEMLRQSFGLGNRRTVIQGPTGFGKTLTAAKIIEGALAKRNRVIFTAPAVSLIDQTVEAFEAEGIRDIGVMQANHPRTDALARVQVASVQTLARRQIPEASLVIVDECFVAGTLIAMADGSQKPVEALRLKDRVLNATGAGEVQALSARYVKETYILEFEDGRSVECTGNHPFFTERGWVEARALVDGSRVVGIEGMPGLWGALRADLPEREGDGRGGLAGAGDLLTILLKEADQRSVQAGGSGEGFGNASADRTQAGDAWRQWVGPDRTPDRTSGRSGDGMDSGAFGERLAGDAPSGDSQSLQDRHCEPRNDDCNRGGWGKSLPGCETGAGSEEGRVSGWSRVVRVSRVEHASDVPVYNVQVSGHPSYFAAGRLVHNCHIRSATIEALMDSRPDVFFVGLSATPWAKGMGLRWQDLVIPCTIGSLIEGGFLSKFVAYAPDVPDLTGVKTVAGDYAEDALASVMGEAQLMANVVDTWLAKGENRPTLCFCVNRAHADQIHHAFERAGVASAYVDGNTDSIEREVIGRLFRAGEIRVICSVRTMTTGVDLPVSCIIDAAPTKSEMLHVQKVGRGLRVNPGTEDLIILDHAGNSLRLGLVTDIHHGVLDKAKPGEKQERKPTAEKLPKECANCATLHAGRICPACGHERKPVAGVDTAEGELVAISGKKKAATNEEKQAWYSALLTIASERRRSKGWVSNTYREKFGVWPRNLDEVRGPAGQDVRNFVKSKDIAFAKSKDRRAA